MQTMIAMANIRQSEALGGIADSVLYVLNLEDRAAGIRSVASQGAALTTGTWITAFAEVVPFEQDWCLRAIYVLPSRSALSVTF